MCALHASHCALPAGNAHILSHYLQVMHTFTPILGFSVLQCFIVCIPPPRRGHACVGSHETCWNRATESPPTRIFCPPRELPFEHYMCTESETQLCLQAGLDGGATWNILESGHGKSTNSYSLSSGVYICESHTIKHCRTENLKMWLFSWKP